MIQIYTILVDSLRLLKAKKLFWIVLSITGMVGFLYASIGFNEMGMSVGFGLKKIENPVVVEGSDFARMFYLLLFTSFINDWWFGFLALALALIASCSVVPEMMKEGSIDVMVSKPLSRLKLFITKYVGVLFFMAVPVLLLCVICFLSMGIRVGVWKWDLFLAVPLLMFVFSLIYCVAVLAGVLWKSSLFALLSAMMFWSTCYVMHIAESLAYGWYYVMPKVGMTVDMTRGTTELTGEEREVTEEGRRNYRLVRAAGAPLPKIRKATLLLKRLVDFDEELGPMSGVSLGSLMAGDPPQGRDLEVANEIEERMSAGYILWSSAGFELVVLSSAAFVFCRRDY
ncbi:MAG: ABC transporter permease [Verrucomicrobia bacterium]|nr:ABC transporter permease [Verrucomicrobiota bacterium]MDA1005040.1 ABC transporter permease [Verrucomicrobiota bacterium]